MSKDERFVRDEARPAQPAASGQDRPARPGRKLDHGRDGDILDATIDVLAEAGYTGMTMDMVATRAKAGKATLYRRWPSKTELVLDAIDRLKQDQIDPSRLPDTGTIRGDLLALFEPQSIAEGERRLRVMAGLASMLTYDTAFAEIGDAAIIEPWAEASRMIIQRGIDRGDVAAGADVATLSRLIPSMAICRALIQRKSAERSFLVSLIDGVLLPALANASAHKSVPR